MNANQLPEGEVKWFLAVGKALGFNFRLEPDFAVGQNAYDIFNGRDDLLYSLSVLKENPARPGKYVLDKWDAYSGSHKMAVDGIFSDAHALFERIIYEQVDFIARLEYRNLREPGY